MKLSCWLICVLGATCAFSAQGSTKPNSDLGRAFLEEAAQGDLEHVYLIQLFGGYLALPRTIDIVPDVSHNMGLDFRVNVYLDTLGETRGWLKPGIYLPASSGHRQDAYSHRELPFGPARSERRGPLIIDYFEPQGDWSQRSVVISDQTFYLHLTGSAVSLTNGLVKAFVSLNASPNVFEQGWRPIQQWQELPEWAAPTLSKNPESDCVGQLFRWVPVISEGKLIGLRVFPGSDLGSFTRLGFRSGDRIAAIDQRPLSAPDSLYAQLRAIARGKSSVFEIDRGGDRVEVRLEPDTVKKAFARCWGS